MTSAFELTFINFYETMMMMIWLLLRCVDENDVVTKIWVDSSQLIISVIYVSHNIVLFE